MLAAMFVFSWKAFKFDIEGLFSNTFLAFLHYKTAFLHSPFHHGVFLLVNGTGEVFPSTVGDACSILFSRSSFNSVAELDDSSVESRILETHNPQSASLTFHLGSHPII